MWYDKSKPIFSAYNYTVVPTPKGGFLKSQGAGLLVPLLNVKKKKRSRV